MNIQSSAPDTTLNELVLTEPLSADHSVKTRPNETTKSVNVSRVIVQSEAQVDQDCYLGDLVNQLQSLSR
tara:strand:- start:15722 stop:15931 length:210 start_codon:yes stop_codon:yes gene_type:complete